MHLIKVSQNDIINGKYQPLDVLFSLVVSTEGYLLVQNKDSGFWELPAGKKEKNEKFDESIFRITKTITGHEIKNIELKSLCYITFENRIKPEYFAIFTSELHNDLLDTYGQKDYLLRWYKHGDHMDKLCSTCKKIIDHFG
jgi:ADP-ribose pyrophosphatase YjhB (NUDIX family)